MKIFLRLPLWSLLLVLALGTCAYTPPQQSQPTASAKSLATIDADVTGYGLIFLRARVNDSGPMWFALDSGASFPFVIDSRRARDLKLRLQGDLTLGGGAGPGAYQASLTRAAALDIGGFKLTDQRAAVFALDSLEAIGGRPLDGLVGVDLFTRYVVEIDYLGHKISLYDPEAYTYSGDGESIPLTQRDKHLFIPAKIEMPGRTPLDGQFLVDTGGGMVTAVLTTPFAHSKGLPAPAEKTILDRSLSGLGGETRLLVTRASVFTIGKFAIREPVIYVSQDTGGALASSDFDGVIGGEILRRFKVIFDYAHARLILEPNPRYAEPVEYDMSGIRLRAEGDDLRTFKVSQVLEGSPAAAAGLREDDVLNTIDGAPASRFSLDEIYQMLKQPGREFKLSFKRGGGTLPVKIKTRRLV